MAKHEQHLGALIPIDHAGLTGLVETLVASALKYGLPVVADVAYSVSISAKVPTSRGRELHLLELLTPFQLFQVFYPQQPAFFFSAGFPVPGLRGWHGISRPLLVDFAPLPCLPFGACL